ncbi:XBP1 Transcriptional repressor XBP1 [Candida maltosa Xu316]
MKPTKVIKSHSRKSSLTTTDNMVSKFSTKSKSKKPKRNHTLIPNNSINYPIHQISSSNDTVLSTHEKEYLNNLIYPKLEIKKYSTSALDPQRNYITAYEYPVNNLWIIWDYETGWVHLTGIWKASLNIEESNVSPSHMKADIVKLLESTPKEYQHYIKRIRGGFLKIQGTWLPYKLCKILARRHALIPIFGVDFPDSCLKPNEKGFGELKLDDLHCFHKSELPIPVSPIQQPAIEKEQQQQQPPPQQQISSSSLPPVGSILPLPQTSPNPQLNTGSFALSNQVPSTPPRRHYSSSSSISSISSSLFSGERITPISAENTGLEIPSFNEMIDIVNASKCLQTLSRDATSPRYMKQESKDTEKTGISAILLAAGLSDVRKNEIIGSPQSDSTVKSINDLLT